MGFLQPSTAQRVGNPEAIQSLFDMTRQQDGEALWDPLYRLRAAEDRLHTAGQIGSIYSQLRAQKEAELGNHATALRYWDSTRPPRDAAGTLPAGTRSVDALAYLTAVGDTAQVIMINERHHAAPDRLLTLELLAPLYERGFRYLAAEAFTATDSALAGRGYPLSGVTGARRATSAIASSNRTPMPRCLSTPGLGTSKKLCRRASTRWLCTLRR